jgi:predicted MFS family arabinose efflux permease
VSNPATGALFAQIVPPAHFANANTWRSTSFELAATLGPPLAGLAIAMTGGAALVYALDAVGMLTFAGVAMTLPRPPDPPPPTREPRAWAAGLRFVFRSELLLAAVTLDMFAVLFGGATALLPMFAAEILHVDATGLGWLRAAPAIGAIAMALVTTRLVPWRRPGRVLLVTVFGFGVATIVFGLSTSFALSFVALVFTGIFDNVSVVIRMTLEQLVTPEALRGRVGAVHNVFIGMSNEMGELESGLAAALLGAGPAVVVGGAATLLVVVVAGWRWPRLRRLGPLAELTPEVPK